MRVVGHRDVPGHPELLGTTAEFLDYFSLKSIEDLPPLADLKSLTDLNLQLPLPVHAAGETRRSTAPTDADAEHRIRAKWRVGARCIEDRRSRPRCRSRRRCRRRRTLRARQFRRGTRRGAAVRRNLRPRQSTHATSAIRRRPAPPSGSRNIWRSAAWARAVPSRNGFARGASPSTAASPSSAQKVSHADDIRLDGRAIKMRASRRPRRCSCSTARPAIRCARPMANARALIDRLPKTAGRRFVAVSPMPGIDGGLELVTSDGALAEKLQRANHKLAVRVQRARQRAVRPGSARGREERQARSRRRA